MLVKGKKYHSIWMVRPEGGEDWDAEIFYIDQRTLPFEFKVGRLDTYMDCFEAIRGMGVRGAPLIGVTAAFGIYLACKECYMDNGQFNFVENAFEKLKESRPTAINLYYCLERVIASVRKERTLKSALYVALDCARKIWKEELRKSLSIGENGLPLIRDLWLGKQKKTINILTHCNAGWLACVDYGTATAPVYLAQKEGIDLHVWVDETRPRNQGARLTCFELLNQKINHTLITDNTGGFLMQKGLVDMVIVGSDRTTLDGNVVNKIGTYLKALAAHDNNIPFYVALPASSFDLKADGDYDSIVIEERDQKEVKYVEGLLCKDKKSEKGSVLITNLETNCLNVGFDITPARYVTAYITDRGVFKPGELRKTFGSENE